jgi:ribosomal protein L37AE/L43A
MQANPAEDWQRLTEHYREMSDGELERLAAEFVDLTETAQQVLRGELRNRGMGEPRAAGGAPGSSVFAAAPRHDWPADSETGGFESDGAGGREENYLPREYTWKTTLCECEDRAEAWQIYEVLRQAGIESWIEGPGSRRSLGNPRVAVAADQLEEAREIAARPIPQEIVDLSRMEEPVFEAPRCPKCGAEDPVLEAVEPANAWLCEGCGHQWTEPAADLDGKLEEDNL